MTYRSPPSRRDCLTMAGVLMTGLVLPGKARADEDPRNKHEQFRRHSVDAVNITIVTRTGHYDFLVAYVSNPGNSDSALIARRQMQPDQGILYANDFLAPLSISNQGVQFPTDLMFVARDGRVLDIHPSIMANDSRVITSSIPVKAALQVIAGTVARISATPGDHLLSSIFGRTL
jgi:uncharacterized protein